MEATELAHVPLTMEIETFQRALIKIMMLLSNIFQRMELVTNLKEPTPL